VERSARNLVRSHSFSGGIDKYGDMRPSGETRNRAKPKPKSKTSGKAGGLKM